jgi:hypothetical protein
MLKGRQEETFKQWVARWVAGHYPLWFMFEAEVVLWFVCTHTSLTLYGRLTIRLYSQ